VSRYRNGRIPAAELAQSRFPAADGSVVEGRAEVIEALDVMIMAAALDGVKIQVVGRRSAYRSIIEQIEMRAQHGRGAAPVYYDANDKPWGVSIHGLGGAFDLVTGARGKAGFRTRFYRWMTKNAARFGFRQPKKMRPGGSLPEPWHWQRDPSFSNDRLPHRLDDEMAARRDGSPEQPDPVVEAIQKRCNVLLTAAKLGPARASTRPRDGVGTPVDGDYGAGTATIIRQVLTDVCKVDLASAGLDGEAWTLKHQVLTDDHRIWVERLIHRARSHPPKPDAV